MDTSTRVRRRAQSRGITAVNAAIGFALVGSLLAIAIPAFIREAYSSRFVEPVEGVTRLGAAAVAYASDKPASEAFPAPAPITPATPPRGTREVDPPGAWDTPTWQALHFTPTPNNKAHAFAFGFDSAHSPGHGTFVAHAHGDLDGDGLTSTFAIHGVSDADDPAGPKVEPGLYVSSEVE
jgi:hypothetical protein